MRSPGLARFLSDFTLGFSDGLTVPFALTAGLGSLGRADTVIFAGLAELCAGSISMGVGGYLAALDEVPARGSCADDADGQDEELTGMLGGCADNQARPAEAMVDEKGAAEDLVRRHLEPLALPGSAVSDMVTALRGRPGGVVGAALQLQLQRRQRQRHSSESGSAPRPQQQRLPVWPLASGLSISLGYVVGGVIPLLPYFFAATVGLGLRWSIGLCLVALMAFGSGKSWVLRRHDRGWRRCLLHGLQMLVLGSLAAAAAVVCVNLVGLRM